MLSSYSASKKRNPARRLDLDAIISNPSLAFQVQQSADAKNPYLEHKWSTMTKRSVMAHSKLNDQDKQNHNMSQSRLDRYNCSVQSPLKQSFISPVKNYDPKSRRSAAGRSTLNAQQNQSKFSYKVTQGKENTYNYNTSKYSQYKRGMPLTPRNSTLYESELKTELQRSRVEQHQPYTSRSSYQPSSSLGVTFSGKNSVPSNITPKKPQVQMADELVEKSQFLRQRMQRINRMTPKGLAAREKDRQESITPEKCIKKESIGIKQTSSTIIVRYNKYCDEKLPLQTIDDAEQHKLEHKQRETVEEAEQGLQQINSLSRKISERLKQIINRHSS